MKTKGFVLNDIKTVELKDIDIGTCGDDQAIIRNRVASICGSDINGYNLGGELHYIPKGSEFGHEMVSEIVELGKNVKDLQVGQRVYPYPMTVKINSRRSACLGGFSEYILVEHAKKDFNLYPVDDTITDKEAALIEPFTVGFRAARRTNPQPGQNGIVFGAGAIGIAAALCLKVMGMDQVMVIDRSQFRIDHCKQLGLGGVNTANPDWKKEVIEYFGEGRGIFGPVPKVEVLIDAAGSGKLFEDIQSLAGLYTTIGVVGVHHKPVPVNLMGVSYSHWSIVGSGGYSPEDVSMVMDVMKSKQFDIESIVTHSFKHEELELALQTATKVDEALKVQIDYNL